MISQGQVLYQAGHKDQNKSDGVYSYRIPALWVTQAGTVLAGADERYDHSLDWGNIDMVLRRSLDHGETWEEPQTLLDLQENSQAPDHNLGAAFLIDMCLVQDPETQRIFAFYDMWPEMKGIFGMPETIEAPYTYLEGQAYLNLYQEDSDQVHTVREEGRVYDAQGQATDYRVDLQGGPAPYRGLGDLYQGQDLVGNIYFTTGETGPYRIARTIYVWCSTSDDDGQTWSRPRDITPMVREPWMNFFGVAPGAGLVLHTGPHQGRLIIPMYSTNEDPHLRGSQASRVIYSDDHGETWQVGQAVNDGRLWEGQVFRAETMTQDHLQAQNTECVAVQLNDGSVKLIMRNLTGCLQIATSLDGGQTWLNEIETYLDQRDVYCQLSAIQFMQGDQEYVLVVNADGPEETPDSEDPPRERINGVARLAKVTGSDLDWVAKRPLQEGKFAYSSLQRLANGDFGIFYEHSSGDSNDYDLVFKTFDWEYLMEGK